MLGGADPKPGDTVVVSDNESAMDSVAGQKAALAGGCVIGIAGSDKKVDWLTEGLRFSAAVNNCSADNIGDLIRSACPDGVDIYVNNVGGTVSDGVVERFNNRAPLAFRDQIVFYNKDDTPRAP
jgi:NADPH-dependent curcumin reductase CurA